MRPCVQAEVMGSSPSIKATTCASLSGQSAFLLTVFPIIQYLDSLSNLSVGFSFGCRRRAYVKEVFMYPN